MGYVDSSLMTGETVVHRSHLHKIMFLIPGIFSIAFIAVGIWLLQQAYKEIYGIGCFVVAALTLLPAYIQYRSSEFAITNKRVIVKTGLIQRRTVETLLQKIEAIGVDQSILGRICNYGTITVIGTGGTRESFDNIANPLAFRRAIQEQTDAKEQRATT